MAFQPTPQQTTEAIHSLKKYFNAELDVELSDLKAKLLLNYLIKEIVPLGYNQGVCLHPNLHHGIAKPRELSPVPRSPRHSLSVYGGRHRG